MNWKWHVAVGGDLRDRIKKYGYKLLCFLNKYS
jgi:hypothetical protein